MQKVVILSDGCQPTEDIYLLRSAAVHLESRKRINLDVIKCWKQTPSNKLFTSNTNFFVVFRTLPAEWIEYLEKSKGQNRLIYVLDDDLRAASNTPELPQKYRTRISSFANNYLDRLLAVSDTLVVTSSHLINTYKSYTPIRLNPIALRLPESVANFNKNSLSIAYHATSSHKMDLEKIQNPLIKTLDTYKCSFESLIGKQTPIPLQKHPSTKLKSPKSYSSFRRFQALTTRHICLAPLFDTPYNNGKSWIKFLDAAAVGAVGIYSNRAPYTEIVDHGVNGLLANDNPEDWQYCLSYLLENPDKARTMAKNALQTAQAKGNYKWSYRFWCQQFS